MDNQPRDKFWERLKDISNILAALVIPLILGFTGYFVSVILEERKTQSKFVELAVDILSENPQLDDEGNPTEENMQIRIWAIEVIEEYSGIKFQKEAREGLKTKPLELGPFEPDYKLLEELLDNKEYGKADDETRKIMYKVSGINDGYLDISAMRNIPCEHIKYLDELWMRYSNDRFGFTPQRDIWVTVSNSKNNSQLNTNERFGNSVGWRKEDGKWLTIAEIHESKDYKKGYFPTRSPGAKEKSLSGGWLVWWLLPIGSDPERPSNACFDPDS